MALPVLRRTHSDEGGHRRLADRPSRLPEQSTGHDVARAERPWDLARRGWDPFEELADLQERMGRLVDDLLGGTTGVEPWSALGWRPMADIEETPDAYVVDIDLPAVKREDVSVEVSPGELAVTGEIKERERTGFLRSRTRRTGRFDYRVSLPSDVDADNVTATLADGVLTVRVPKTERAKRRKVQITS